MSAKGPITWDDERKGFCPLCDQKLPPSMSKPRRYCFGGVPRNKLTEDQIECRRAFFRAVKSDRYYTPKPRLRKSCLICGKEFRTKPGGNKRIICFKESCAVERNRRHLTPKAKKARRGKRRAA